MIFKIKKARLLSAFLAIAMIVTLMPATAFAAEPPTLVSAAVTSNGGVGLTFSKEMSAADLTNKIKAGFNITGLEETPKTITSVTLHSASGGTNNFVQLYLDPTVKGGEAASLSYTPSDVQAYDGGILAEIASMDIENNAPHPDLVTTTPPAATRGSSYTHTFTAGGGTGPYTFSVDSGDLPRGLTMSSTGAISGTPTEADSFTFFIMVEDVNQAVDIEEFNITVSPPTEKVCEIGGTQYATLDEALTALADNTPATINLLKDVTSSNGILLSRKKLMLDLNGKELTIQNSAGIGVDMKLLSELIVTGPGILNIDAQMAGLSMNQSKFTASENVVVEINSDTNLGLYTDTECTVSFHGDVSGASGGIYVGKDNTIMVSGTATATGSGERHAVHLNNTGNTVLVGSAIVSSGTGTGLHIGEHSGGSVTVGSVEAPGQIVGKGNGIHVRMGMAPATVTVYGDVEGASYGIYASDDSTITVHGNVKSGSVASDCYGVYCSANNNPSNIIINGNVEGVNGVYAQGAQSELTVNGNVTATGLDAATNVGARAYYAKIHINGNITANNCIGAYSFESSEIVIDGTITAARYIKVKYADKTIADMDAASLKAGYRQYSSTNAFVWVEDATPGDICEIGGTQYATLDAALATINEGETKTITLLKNIDYDKGITLNNKKITFALNGYTLNVVSSIEGVHALDVYNGGGVALSGTGALNVTGPARGYGVTVHSNSTSSVVTVTNATGIGTESKAAHAYNKASLTVLENVTATGISSFGVHAQTGAIIEVGGNVSADNQGVCVSDATAKIAGNIQSNGNDLIGNPEGIGVNVYDGVAEIGGNVTANRVGAMIRAGGSITIDGTLTAPDYIQFADDAPTAINGYLATTTKPGYRTYQHATAGTIWIKGEIPATTYALTVANGTGSGSYAKDAVITIAADTAPSGQRFKEWSITPSVTYADSTNKTRQTAKIIMPAQSVAATAVYELLPASEYTITVQNDGNGIASANFNSAAEGEEITLTAMPGSGYRFKEWQVISGGVTIVNNKFSVLDSNITVKAFFEPIPASTYTVTFILNGGTHIGGGELTQTVPSGGSATAPNTTRSGYTFIGWDKAFNNVTSNLTIMATWSYNSGGGSSSGGSGGSSSSDDKTTTSSPTTSEKKPDQPITAVAPFTVTAGKNGAANASIPDKVITDAIDKAQADAKAQGKTANGISVELRVTMPKGTTSLMATLTRSSLNRLISTGITNLTMKGSPLTVTFDQKALAEIQKQSSGDIGISIAPELNISAAARKMIGTRPVYDLTVAYTQNGKDATVSSFGGGAATISIPYTLGKNEAIGGLYAVYVDEKGNAVRIAGSGYDSNSRSVIFTTTHFSLYGVGYKAPSAEFTDIANHWGKEAIDYVVGRGLLSGTSETTFAPNTATTRGMLVTALGRLAGVDTKTYTTNSFTDVKADSTFRPYIEWAYKKGVVQGIGNQQFAPDRVINRVEIAVIFANYAKATGYTLPATRNAVDYADASDIGSAYKAAVAAMNQAGIMMGVSSNKFNPKANATRAEVASMLHRYIKLS